MKRKLLTSYRDDFLQDLRKNKHLQTQAPEAKEVKKNIRKILYHCDLTGVPVYI
ncbi:MAG: hypothetical protein AAF696_33595 [Bacteroidota bacterium]